MAESRSQTNVHEIDEMPPELADRLEAAGYDDLDSILNSSIEDLTAIDGIDSMTVETIWSEVGPDLSALADEDHFASWLGLAPRRDISGGQVVRHLRTKGRNRVANALRMAAQPCPGATPI